MNQIVAESTVDIVDLLLSLCLIFAIAVAAIELMKLINVFLGRRK